jgi:hypothetical protein
MTDDEVKAVKGCGEHKPIGTGDVECPAYDLGGKKRNVSFHFAEGKLHKIQVWFAEAMPHADAELATDELIAYLTRTHGEIESHSLPAGTPVSRAALFTALDALPAGQLSKVQLKPSKDPPGTVVFASVIRDPRHGYFVFLYYDSPGRGSRADGRQTGRSRSRSVSGLPVRAALSDLCTTTCGATRPWAARHSDSSVRPIH